MKYVQRLQTKTITDAELNQMEEEIIYFEPIWSSITYMIIIIHKYYPKMSIFVNFQSIYWKLIKSKSITNSPKFKKGGGTA